MEIGRDQEKKIKGSWSPEEDAMLRNLVDLHGARNWTLIGSGIRGRSGKSCRLRWFNQLSPAVHHRPFTPEEDAAIVAAHAIYGNKWSTISRLLPGRTDNAVKNHWNSGLRRGRQRALPSAVSGNEESESESVGKRRCRREKEDPATSLSLGPPGESSAVGSDGGGWTVRNEWLMSAMRKMIAEEVRRYLSGGDREEAGGELESIVKTEINAFLTED